MRMGLGNGVESVGVPDGFRTEWNYLLPDGWCSLPQA